MIQIKAVLFDIGGVLWHPKPPPLREKWAARCGLSVEAFDQIVYESEWGSQALVGSISAEQMWENIGKQLGLSYAETCVLEKEYWTGTWDTALLDYCRTQKPKYKMGIISDAESNAREMVSAWVNETLFDTMVFSAELGVCKPNPPIFHHALEQLGVGASEAVFIDDRVSNIDGAKSLGIHTIHYQSRGQVLIALNQYIPSE